MITKNEYEKNMAKALPKLNTEELHEAANTIQLLIGDLSKTKYIMLLSNELNYYTIFNLGHTSLKTSLGIAVDIVGFLTNDKFLKTLGDLKLVEDNLENEHIEIWIGETYFSLFVCDSFIVNL